MLTMAACGEVACPFSVSHQSVPQFSVEQCSRGYQRTSPASAACCPLRQTSYDRQVIQEAQLPHRNTLSAIHASMLQCLSWLSIMDPTVPSTRTLKFTETFQASPVVRKNSFLEYYFDDQQYLLSFVDGLEGFGELIKRRSFRRFLSPALFHQSQDARMHSISFLLRKFRSVERCTSVFDFLHDHYNHSHEQTHISHQFMAAIQL